MNTKFTIALLLVAISAIALGKDIYLAPKGTPFQVLDSVTEARQGDIFAVLGLEGGHVFSGVLVGQPVFMTNQSEPVIKNTHQWFVRVYGTYVNPTVSYDDPLYATGLSKHTLYTTTDDKQIITMTWDIDTTPTHLINKNSDGIYLCRPRLDGHMSASAYMEIQKFLDSLKDQ